MRKWFCQGYLTSCTKSSFHWYLLSFPFSFSLSSPPVYPPLVLITFSPCRMASTTKIIRNTVKEGSYSRYTTPIHHAHQTILSYSSMHSSFLTPFSLLILGLQDDHDLCTSVAAACALTTSLSQVYTTRYLPFPHSGSSIVSSWSSPCLLPTLIDTSFLRVFILLLTVCFSEWE